MATITERPTASVVGAGPTGALAALLLAKRNYTVNLYEARSSKTITPQTTQQRQPQPPTAEHADASIQKVASAHKRSINLALSHRGLSALHRASLDKKALEIAVPMRGRMVHARDGSTSLQSYGSSPDEVLYSISRNELNALLVDALRPYTEGAEPRVALHHDHKLTSLRRSAEPGGSALCATFGTPDGAIDVRVPRLLGCDGAFSATRGALSRLLRLSQSIEYISHVYKELDIPADSSGGYAMFAEALHIWPAADSMLIALPNLDCSFTATLFADADALEALDTPAKVLEFFESRWPETLSLMPRLADDFCSNPSGALSTVRCEPWFLGGDALLLGDAAHAVVPFYGQGMNCALEDVERLDEALELHSDNWAAALPTFARARKHATDALSLLALDNYAEMRDKTVSRFFLLKSALHGSLHAALGCRWFPSLHTAVSFTSMPYDEARASFARQDLALTGALLVACASASGWAMRMLARRRQC